MPATFCFLFEEGKFSRSSYTMVCFALLLSWYMLPATICSALPTEVYTSDTLSLPLPPSQDPFYTAPAGYEAEKPGIIFRIW